MEHFNFPVSYDASASIEHRVLEARFGDGYAQRAGDGLNTRKSTWDLSCTGSASFIEEVKAFIDAHGGYKAFTWSPRNHPPALFTCAGYKIRSRGAGIAALSFSFEQTYHP